MKPADALRQHCLGPPAPSPAVDTTAAAPMHRGWRSRGYLPHCDGDGLLQHVVFGLWDALPRKFKAPSTMHADRALDAGYGCCLLRDAPCAAIVQECLLHDDEHRYELLAWCIMPNHVHVLFQQNHGGLLDEIVQAWKSTAAHRINHQLDRKGRLWRREYFDRFMRDDDHVSTAIAYIEDNPVKARLVSASDEWPWSSAAWRFRDAGEGAGGPR